MSALIVFMRAPYPGKVKTRLARSIGDEKAAEFYRLCLDAIIKDISQLSREVVKYIFITEITDVYQTDYLASFGFKIAVQEGDNLGQRLCDAFHRVFDDGARKVVIVASDVPDLSVNIMKEAISGLDNSDIVIGPCYDGGYYLVGMNELHRELFHEISWGTELVYRQTIDAAKNNGLIVRLLPVLLDIDTVADLHQWSQRGSHKKSAIMEFVRAIHL